jgi:hypothetical protein
MLEIESVTGNKTNLELDFRAAWRDWSYTKYFPQVKAGPVHDDVLRILRKSATRRGTRVAMWKGAGPFVPWTELDWSFKDLAVIIHEAIPAHAWEKIVRNWLRPTS